MAPTKRGECRAAVQLLLLLQLISDTASTWQVIGYHTAKGDAEVSAAAGPRPVPRLSVCWMS